MFLCSNCKAIIELPRFFARGFSDQVAVPEEKHKLVLEKLLIEFKEKYGENFDKVTFK